MGITAFRPVSHTTSKGKIMTGIKTWAAVTALSLLSFYCLAETVTATADNLDDAEAVIAARAKKAGESYTITEATMNNQVHMTAELHK